MIDNYQAPPTLLQDKIILVTGAGSGLGRAAALAYARHGATVILLGRTLEKLEETYDAITTAGGAEPALITLDLEKAGEAEYTELAATLAQECGRLDGLLHSAGLSSATLPLEHVTLHTWQQLLQVNLHAAFALTRYCLPLLRQAALASILFTSARAGREVRAYQGPYAVAKHGIETLVQLFHQELANTSGIRVNSLDPGPCATALRKVNFPSENPATLPSPESLMPLYLYLMGDDSRHEQGRQFSCGKPRV
jgi:NAD(P)-dependent dehydrogenase (short-subunit alcohol dehydrogenase family)